MNIGVVCEDGGYDLVCGWCCKCKDNVFIWNFFLWVVNMFIGVLIGVCD